MKEKLHAAITGTGAFVPKKVLTNFHLEQMVDTSDEWITQRTGIKERRIVEDGYATSDVALEAAKLALEDARVKPEQLDLIMIATVTPDYPVPSTACILQDKLKAKNAAVLDIGAACAGFIYGLSLAKPLIESGQYKTILVIGVELLSTITDWSDRNTCVLFGDGAGAAVVQPTRDRKGILETYIAADGSYYRLLHIPVGGSKTPLTKENFDLRKHYLKMEGSEVFKIAVKTMGDSALKVLKKAGLSQKDVDLLIPHQANLRIIEATAKRLKIPREKVMVNLDRYGNTSSASVPIALDEARKTGLVKKGDVTVLVAFGGGLTWGSIAIKW